MNNHIYSTPILKNSELWYFETSALNWLCDNWSPGDAIATKTFQNLKNREWVISPTCIWEILLTSNELKKDEIIYFSQLLFSSEMLLSPEEILIDFIEKGFPRKETGRLKQGKCSISKTWRNIAGNTDKTFVIDDATLKKLTVELRKINKQLDRVLRNENIPLFGKGVESSIKITLEASFNRVSFKGKKEASLENIQIYKVSIFYMLMILCSGIGINRGIIDTFWKKYGLNNIEERFSYALENFTPMIYRGPLALLSMMTVVQSKQPYSRGVFFDSLHAMYSSYCHRFITADNHFIDLRNSIGHSPLSLVIYHINELEFIYHPRKL